MHKDVLQSPHDHSGVSGPNSGTSELGLKTGAKNSNAHRGQVGIYEHNRQGIKKEMCSLPFLP